MYDYKDLNETIQELTGELDPDEEDSVQIMNPWKISKDSQKKLHQIINPRSPP